MWRHCEYCTVTVSGCQITVSDKLKTFCVTLDAARTFDDYVNYVAKACNFYMWGLCHIRRSISRDVVNIMAACIVGTRVVYCNALLHCTTDKSLNKLQRAQNKLARIVSNVTTLQQHTVVLLPNLHWLPIRSRITFKVATSCYNAYRISQPIYLLDTLEQYVSCRGQRSAEMDLLTVPTPRTKTAERRFSSAAPTVWNGLPLVIRNSDNIGTFKSHISASIPS